MNRCTQPVAVVAVCAIVALALAGCRRGSTWPAGPRVSGSLVLAVRTAPPAAPVNEEPQFSREATLADYLAYAALHNPGLEAAFYRWKAAVERAPQVSSLPDPRFTYRYFVEEVETRVGAQRQSVGLAQTFPWFGKLALRGEVATEQANAQYQRYQGEKLRLFFRVKDAYYEYYYLWRAIQTVRENLALVQQFESVAQARYRAAVGSHPDVIRAQVELGKLADRLTSLQSLRTPIVAGLNAALNRPAGAPLPWPEAIESEDIAVDVDALKAMLLRSNPQLRRLDADIARAEREIDLAKKDYFPDFTLGVDYIDTSSTIGPMNPSDDGKDPVIVMASVNLPIWRDRLDAGLREARYRRRRAFNARANRENELSAQFEMALYGFQDADRKIDLYGDTLLPKARQSIKATDAAFRAGKASFLDLIDTERILLEFELAHERALANRMQRLAELEMLAGGEISSSGNPDSSQGVR